MAEVVITSAGEHHGRVGRIVNSTKNGWYSVSLPDNTVVKVRGRANLQEITETVRAEVVEDKAHVEEQAEPQEDVTESVDLYEKASRLTRSEAAALRRDEMLRRIVDLNKVKHDQLRIVVVNKNKQLVYQHLCNNKTVTVSDNERDDLLQKSAHFRRAWDHCTHHDSARLWGLNQDTPHVIYMAVMTFESDLVTESNRSNKMLQHTTQDQAYVGLAKHGIAHRWGAYKYNHVRSANEAGKREGKPALVDATMRWHCAQGGTVWLFVVQHNDDLPLRSEETRLIHYFGTHGPNGMNATK